MGFQRNCSLYLGLILVYAGNNRGCNGYMKGMQTQVFSWHQMVIHSVISDSHSTFIKGRQILDGILWLMRWSMRLVNVKRS